MSDTTLLLEKLDSLSAKIERLERKLELHSQYKAVYNQKEIVAALGLRGKQRELLDYMKEKGILHSPVTKKPLTYPGAVVRKAIERVSAGKL